jgi:hypothetical protein
MRVVRSLILIAVVALPPACLDMPVTRLSKTDDPIVIDAGEDGGSDPQVACRACITAPNEPGPGCLNNYTTCVEHPLCKIMINCAFDLQCYQGSRKAFLTCAYPCLEKAGITTGNEEVITIASTLFTCSANGPCGNICFSSE